eukprot:2054400-Lingulodinium_polyedra.AAC.1
MLLECCWTAVRMQIACCANALRLQLECNLNAAISMLFGGNPVAVWQQCGGLFDCVRTPPEC